jgi:hypothetical protein
MTTDAHTAPTAASIRTPVLWGLVFGALQAASPLSFFWLDPAVVYALSVVPSSRSQQAPTSTADRFASSRQAMLEVCQRLMSASMA